VFFRASSNLTILPFLAVFFYIFSVMFDHRRRNVPREDFISVIDGNGIEPPTGTLTTDIVGKTSTLA
jgi:hypothetical protein